MSNKIAVSTAWNALRHKSAGEMIGELQRLGFGAFELNVHLNEDMLRDIEAMDIEVSSLHNFCPVPDGVREHGSGDFYSLCSTDKVERQKAVDGTMRTIEWAEKLHAKAVVLHMGRPVAPHHHDEICAMRLEGRNDEADKILMADLAARAKNIGPCLDAALKSVREIAEKTAGDVLLGIETRLIYNEIPNYDEMQLFMDLLSPQNGGYWHDFGHAHMQELVGVFSHWDWLSRYSDRLVGMHIHDSKGCQDHGPLTLGTLDFARFMPLIPKSAISVLEIHKHANAEQLAKSREIWEGLLSSKS